MRWDTLVGSDLNVVLVIVEDCEVLKVLLIDLNLGFCDRSYYYVETCVYDIL